MVDKNHVFDKELNLVDNSPLIKLNKITSQFNSGFYKKIESFNHGHSSKDRIALHSIEQAENQGILKSGNTIIEIISSTIEFNIAMVSIIKGYDCILVIDSKYSKDKIDMLRTMGAKIYTCPDNSISYYKIVKKLLSEIKGSVYINEYFNQLNIEAYYKYTESKKGNKLS